MLSCLCCQSTEFQSIGEKNNYRIYICKKCKTLNSVRIVGNEENFDYSEYYSESGLTIPDFVLKRLSEIIGDFESFRQTNRFLDVGCGAGTILKVALSQDWQAEGLEVSDSSVEFLKANNFKVFHGELTEANFPENHFDVVTAAEIIEHISDPQELFDETFRILRVGGLFWGTTPHGNGLSGKVLGTEWSCVAPPEHLHLLSVKGLYKMLEKAGFRQIEIKTHSVNLYEIIQGLKKTAKQNRDSQTDSPKKFNPVQTSYDLNERLLASSWRKHLKSMVNVALNITKLGDSLKIKAVK